jgi:hypothetical protein
LLGALAITAPLVACSSTPDEVDPTPTPSATTTGTTPPASCGAQGPSKCAIGATCQTAADCESTSCQGGKCVASSCTNGQQDGTETGVDCGGTCSKKCDGEPCTKGEDCKSTTCSPDGTCAPAGSKTCGVGLPVTCKNGEPCGQDKDCETDYCRALACAAPPPTVHQDGRRNAGETGVDCGGTAKPDKLCGAGEKCVDGTDCLSTCTNGKCDAPSPTDAKKNNGETDVDCGGPNAPKCAVGKACVANGDCGLDLCDANKCATPTASDDKKNGGETDVDCGGTGLSFGGVTVPPAPKCEAGKTCGVDGDCASGACAFNKKCVEGPSCRNLNGGYTCGAKEVGQAGVAHESCCKTLPVPGLTMMHDGVQKQVYVDKYEITAGRIREWIADMRRMYAGAPNIKAWIEAKVAADALVASQISEANRAFLPMQDNNQITYIAPGNIDIGLNSQIGPTSYYRGWSTGGTSGCYLGAGGYGHRTYWFDAALSASFNEVARPPAMQAILDQKSMNCMTPIMFAAFCAWDGGYLISQQAIAAAYGPDAWPWGPSPSTAEDRPAILPMYANYNPGTSGFNATKTPTYLFPVVNYDTFANDLSPVIAAPGRFQTDVSQVKPIAGSDESWMDLGGNMIEWSNNNGTFHGWTGASFEGHIYPRGWTGTVVPFDKYGKGGGRCMRLR